MINASGDNLSYQWFVDTGGGFDTINGTHYAGVDTPILEIIGAPFSFNNNYYMCVVSNCSSINSNHAKLTVIPREPVLRTIGNNGTTINNNLLMY